MSTSVDLAWLIYGPLNANICQINHLLKTMVPLAFIILCDVIAIWKFFFICVWKSYRNINDSFLTCFTVTSAFLVSFLVSLASSFGPGKTPTYKIICSGYLSPEIANDEPRFINIGFVFMAGIFSYLLVLIPVLIKKRLIKIEENIHGTKNLVSHKSNAIVLIAIGGFAILKLIDSNDFHIYTIFYNQFILPFLSSTTICINILKKHGKEIDRELFGGYFNLA